MYSKFYFSYMKIPLYKILMYNSLTNQFKNLLKNLMFHFELMSMPSYLVYMFVVSFDFESFSQHIGKAQRGKDIV